jgi:hypothetical protein
VLRDRGVLENHRLRSPSETPYSRTPGSTGPKVLGVSTRKVDDLMAALGGRRILAFRFGSAAFLLLATR